MALTIVSAYQNRSFPWEKKTFVFIISEPDIFIVLYYYLHGDREPRYFNEGEIHTWKLLISHKSFIL